MAEVVSLSGTIYRFCNTTLVDILEVRTSYLARVATHLIYQFENTQAATIQIDSITHYDQVTLLIAYKDLT
jgi:hypothetical protein